MGHDERGGKGLPVDVGQARVLTAQIRAAIAEVMRSGAVLADRVRQAHESRIWTVLGYTSWAAYASA